MSSQQYKQSSSQEYYQQTKKQKQKIQFSNQNVIQISHSQLKHQQSDDIQQQQILYIKQSSQKYTSEDLKQQKQSQTKIIKKQNVNQNDAILQYQDQQQNNQKIESVGVQIVLKKNPKYNGLKIEIISLQSQSFFKIQTQFYQILVKNQNQQKWEVKRRYSDFQWLFNALINTFPGMILPYFPQKTIESFMVNKLNIEYGSISKQQTLQKRKQQLSFFLQGVCQHQLFRYSEQLSIFLQQNDLIFAKQKKNIQAALAQTQVIESTGKGIFSLVQRSIAWITTGGSRQSNNQNDQMPQWQQTQAIIVNWVRQITDTLQNVQKMILLKAQEIQWQGPQTQIDSVEILKAKVISGRSYNAIFLDQLRAQVTRLLDKHAKSLKQIEYQLNLRSQMKKMIIYLKKNSINNQARMNKLIRKKDIFEKNMIKEWTIYQHNLKTEMVQIHKAFKTIWKRYCVKMNKIWK